MLQNNSLASLSVPSTLQRAKLLKCPRCLGTMYRFKAQFRVYLFPGLPLRYILILYRKVSGSCFFLLPLVGSINYAFMSAVTVMLGEGTPSGPEGSSGPEGLWILASGAEGFWAMPSRAFCFPCGSSLGNRMGNACQRVRDFWH